MKQFEWCREKERENLSRHGISFWEAKKAFADPRSLIIPDVGHSQKEKRFFCIGEVNGKIMTVRFTMRGEAIRIIGAGYWRKGRKRYEREMG